ncbi:hypothetical protein B0J12DRAFT_673339 [Macrophomina phaseolina]|uniref:Uncharacterized protein n=1 Tax=Macrophomina phaseolina TaxID=35725 RepID=A0ABQ8G1Y7_9PEZI|nr:hypothetical protein B0J12DRAFT_673339 [Macrophomina phaseolina]
MWHRPRAAGRSSFAAAAWCGETSAQPLSPTAFFPLHAAGSHCAAMSVASACERAAEREVCHDERAQGFAQHRVPSGVRDTSESVGPLGTVGREGAEIDGGLCSDLRMLGVAVLLLKNWSNLAGAPMATGPRVTQGGETPKREGEWGFSRREQGLPLAVAIVGAVSERWIQREARMDSMCAVPLRE